MEHIVFFPAQDGAPAYRRVTSLEDAVRLVEHLRNVEQVADVSVHALTEVPLAFRAYYKVEVAGVLEGPGDDLLAAPYAEAPREEAARAEAPREEELYAEAELPPLVTVAQAGPGVRNGAHADVRGLGFFAS